MKESEKVTGSEPIGKTEKPNSSVEETDEKEYINCIWNGHVYSPGSYLCRGEKIKMVCQANGTWITYHVNKCT